MTMSELAEKGVVIGRFQILHNDHKRYILTASKFCQHLIVAITNPDPVLTGEDQADTNRSLPSSNPLTYFERYTLVKNLLLDQGFFQNDFSIVPLPINFPKLYKYYIPQEAVFFLTIYDQWGRRKQEFLQSLGLKVEILWEVNSQDKGISGKNVRQLIRDEGNWMALVPDCLHDLLRSWKMSERLRNLE